MVSTCGEVFLLFGDPLLVRIMSINKTKISKGWGGQSTGNLSL